MKKSLSTGATIPPDQFYNEIGIQYQKAYGNNPGLQEIIRRFLDLLPADARVLDCGCGTGKPVSDMVAASGRRVYGIDWSQTMVDLSRNQVQSGSFERISMLEYSPTDDFQGIVTMMSLFDLTREEITTMASKWFQWLQPSGVFLLGVLGAEDLQTPAEMYDSEGQCATNIPYTFMNHTGFMTLFTKQGWIDLMKKAGFEILHTETYLFVPSIPSPYENEPYYFLIARKPAVA